MDPSMPASLGDAMSSEPGWLRAWVAVLAAAHFAALPFVAAREGGRFRVRPEAVAILAAFVGAGVAMGRLYEAVGYVRLLGLAHLVCWGPVYAWILTSRLGLHPLRSAFGIYLRCYLLIAGVSLAIDAVDVARHFAGDGALWGRHAAGGVQAGEPPLTRSSD